MNLPRNNLKLFAVWIALCVLGGVLLGWWAGMSFWRYVAIVSAALLVHSVVAECVVFFNSRSKFK
jgi:hypothetical protein